MSIELVGVTVRCAQIYTEIAENDPVVFNRHHRVLRNGRLPLAHAKGLARAGGPGCTVSASLLGGSQYRPGIWRSMERSMAQPMKGLACWSGPSRKSRAAAGADCNAGPANP